MRTTSMESTWSLWTRTPRIIYQTGIGPHVYHSSRRWWACSTGVRDLSPPYTNRRTGVGVGECSSEWSCPWHLGHEFHGWNAVGPGNYLFVQKEVFKEMPCGNGDWRESRIQLEISVPSFLTQLFFIFARINIYPSFSTPCTKSCPFFIMFMA